MSTTATPLLENSPEARLAALTTRMERIEATNSGALPPARVGSFRFTIEMPGTLAGLVVVNDKEVLWNGAELDKSDWPALNTIVAAQGYPWGSTATTFIIGNALDREVMLAGSTFVLGGQGGASSVTLNAANLPSHTHPYTPTGTVAIAPNPHSHTYQRAQGSGTAATAGSTALSNVLDTTNAVSLTAAFTGTAGTTGATGSGTPVSVTGPYTVLGVVVVRARP